MRTFTQSLAVLVRVGTPARLIATLAIIATLHLGACKKTPPDAAPPDPAPAKDEHGHDHAHGEEHVDEVRLTADAVTRYGIKVEAAQLWQLRPTFIAPARIAFNSEAMAHVGSPLRGRAVDVKVKLGSMVKAGDELVVVESPELGEAQSDYLGKRTAAQTAVPAVDLAKAAWERAKGLYDEGQSLISVTEVQKREAEHKVAIAALKAAESAAGAAENRLHLLGASQADVDTLAKSGEVNPRLIIRAPIGGQVVERELTLGELVSPDREALLVIADTSVLWVLADIPEARIRSVAPGAKAWVSVGGIDGTRIEGTIAFISPMVDAATRTAQVRIEVATAERTGVALVLKPGMFAQVEIVATDPATTEPVAVVAVPAEAVQTVEGEPAVFVPVPKEENTFAKRPVTIGKAVGGLIPIHAGLAEGEQYVVAGTFLLKADLGKSGASHEH